MIAKGPVCGLRFLRCLPDSDWTPLFTIGLLIPSIGFSMLITNAVLWLIPPVRRIFDREAAPFPETGFKNAQRQLLRFTLLTFMACGVPAAFALWKMLYG